MSDQLPFLTRDLPGVSGLIKSRYEDFQVEEIPAYDAVGEGTHTFFLIEKAGLTTMQAARDVARALGVAPHDVGYAGLKDARALTRQWFSVEHVAPEKVAALDLPKIRVVRTSRHFNKIKIGHLSGNRFRIRVREFRHGAEDDARAILTALSTKGVPNYFGPQRFGARGDTWRMGAAMLRGDLKDALDQYLGRPGPQDRDFFQEARRAYDQSQFARAHDIWPYMYRDERKALKVLAGGGPPHRAWFAVDRSLKRLFLSAYQSRLFNLILAERVDRLDRLEDGDLAFKHDTGAVFRVENAAAEQPRADRFEISPTGPLFGYRMTRPGGEPGRREDALLAAEGLNPESFREADRHPVKGGRRPLRFKPYDSSVASGLDKEGPFLEFRFVLKKGCYATSLLREILKNESETGEAAAPDESGEGDAEE
jgi:tRNA pseudouridine13 synthase